MALWWKWSFPIRWWCSDFLHGYKVFPEWADGDWQWCASILSNADSTYSPFSSCLYFCFVDWRTSISFFPLLQNMRGYFDIGVHIFLSASGSSMAPKDIAEHARGSGSSIPRFWATKFFIEARSGEPTDVSFTTSHIVEWLKISPNN